MLAQSMRPQWKTDTYYIPTPDGVYLRGNANRLILKGKSLYPLLERLVPHLNGSITLEEITGGLDADRKRMVTHLIEKLAAHHFLQDTSQNQPHTLLPAELETRAQDIAFIESFQSSAAYRFEDFRNKHLLLIGSGPGFAALVQASLQCGVKQISAIVTPEAEAGANVRQDVLDVATRYASEQTVQLLDALAWENEAEVRATLQAYDAILHVAERPVLARAQLLNRLCVELQKPLLQAIVVKDYAWVGPLVCPETGACWECAWRRLQANLTELPDQCSSDAFLDQAATVGNRTLTQPEATVIANRMLFVLFQHFTQTGSPETAGKISAIDLTTLLSENHAFLPHPHCLASQHPVAQTAARFLEHIQHLQRQDPIDLNVFVENFIGCVDEKSGPFTAFDNTRFVQAPLAVYQVTLANSFWNERPAEALAVSAASIDTRDAGIRTAQKACEWYAAHLMDQRRLPSPEIRQQESFPTISADQLVGIEAPAPENDAWTWALDLQTQQASLVPAAAVFSALPRQERGVAAGQTWEEALCLALLDQCNYLTVEQLQNTQQVYPQVDLENVSMTPEGTHLYRLLKAADAQITVYDVTGPLGVPTLATCLGEKVVAYTTHCADTQALDLGLTQALQYYQAEQFQQPDYRPAPVADFPLRLRGDQFVVPGTPCQEAWSERLARLLQQVQAGGFSALAVPLNHDPALARVLPFIARVLLSRRELKRGE